MTGLDSNLSQALQLIATELAFLSPESPEPLVVISGALADLPPASRMESTSGNGRIQVSAITHELLKEHFVLEEREMIECKGLGPMLTSYVNGRIQT